MRLGERCHCRLLAVIISRGIFFLKNFELLIFSCREIIKRSIHILYDVSKINSFIYRKRIFCVITVILALFIDSKTLKYLMRFLHYAFFLAKVMFRYYFLGHYLFAELNEICCGSLFSSILKTYRRKFL